MIVIFFILNLIRAIAKTQGYFYATGNHHDIFSFSSYFRSTIFLLIPMIGLFLKNKVGWVFITSYFYFILTNILFSYSLFDHNDHYASILPVILITGLISLIIVAMNKKKISLTIYNIQRSVLILYNIATFIIGVSITIWLAYAKSSFF